MASKKPKDQRKEYRHNFSAFGGERTRYTPKKDRGDDSDCDESTDSEADYQSSAPFIDLNGYPESKVKKSWRSQRGICRITGVPLSGKSGLYSPIATLRVFSKKADEDNIIVVCRVVHEMRTATSLPWRQFAQIVKIFGYQIGNGFQF